MKTVTVIQAGRLWRFQAVGLEWVIAGSYDTTSESSSMSSLSDKCIVCEKEGETTTDILLSRCTWLPHKTVPNK